VSHDASDFSLAECTNLTIETLKQISSSREELPSPTEITDAVRPVIVTSEGRKAIGSVSDEASHGMGVQSQEERNEQMVSVPEGLKRLLADLVMGGRVHQEHAE
jgi:hypothetical protein